MTPDLGSFPPPAVHGGVRVLLVDDHHMVATGLAAALSDEQGIEVVGVAPTLAEGVAMSRDLAPDVVVLDYRLPDGDGVEGTRRLRALADPPQVVVLTAAADDRVLRDALAAGCCGFLTKGATLDELDRAVRAAAAGEAVFSSDVIARLARLSRGEVRPEETLSPRELGVLRAMATGASAGEIARDLRLSEHTVRNHVRNVLAKLGAHTKTEAVVTAARAGLIDLDRST